MKKVAGLMILLLLLTGLSYGQRAYIAGISYLISSPTGNTKDFVDTTSYLGFCLEGRKFVSDHFSVGASLQWNAFEQEEAGPALAKHTMNAYPLMAIIHAYPTSNDKFIPYAGLGIGAVRIYQRVERVFDINEKDAWHFGLAPELGAVVRLGTDVGMLFNVKYIQAFESGDKLPAQSFFSVSLGFLWLHSQ